MKIFYNRPLAFSLLVFLSVFVIIYFLTPVIKLAILCVGFIAATVTIVIRKELDKLTGAFCALVAASLLSYLYFDLYLYDAIHMEKDNAIVTAEVYNISYKGDESMIFDAELLSINGEKCDYLCHFNAESGNDIVEGDVIYCEVEFVEFSDDNNGFDEASYYHSKGIWLNCEVSKDMRFEKTGHNSSVIRDIVFSVREGCSEIFSDNTDPESGAFLSALALGDKSELSDSTERNYQRCGISHMLAVSGMHLAVLMGCVARLGSKLGKKRGAILTILLCLFYIIISGASSSVLRAGMMFVIISLSPLFSRRGDSLTSLFTAVSLILIFSPSSIFDIGLILSFTSTLGIIIIVGPFMRKRNPQSIIAKGVNYIILSVVTTLSALAFSLVPMLIFFDSFSLVTLVCNILFAPVITLILSCVPILIIVSPIPFISSLVGSFIGFFTTMLDTLVDYAADISGICISLNYPFVNYLIAIFGIGVVITLIIKKRNGFILAYLLWFTLFTGSVAVYEISILDESDIIFSVKGENDAILLRSEGDSTYLDLGKGSKASAKTIFYYLEKELYDCELDNWVITNYNDNYKSTLYKYLNYKFVSRIYLPISDDPYDSVGFEELSYICDSYGCDVIRYEYGKPLKFGGLRIEIDDPNEVRKNGSDVIYTRIEAMDKVIDYYSCGYFDYGDKKPCDADIVFVGASGTARKQRVSPLLECNTLIFAKNNSVAVKNISRTEQYDLSGDKNYCEIRISE